MLLNAFIFNYFMQLKKKNCFRWLDYILKIKNNQFRTDISLDEIFFDFLSS